MKILQLRSTRPPRFEINLHPQLTVVRGLDGPLRLELADTFTSIAAGRPVSMFGLIEAHGVLLDLDGAALRMVLGLGGEALLPVLRGSDLPAPRGADTGDDLPDAATARRLLAQTVADAEVELQQAQYRRDDLATRARRHLTMLSEPPALDSAEGLQRREADEVVARAAQEVRAADRILAETIRMIDDHRDDLEAAGRIAAARTRHARAADALARTVAAHEGAGGGIDHGVLEALRVAVAREAELQSEHDTDPTVRAWSDQHDAQGGEGADSQPEEAPVGRKEVSAEQRNSVRMALRVAEAVAASTPSTEALRLAERWTRAASQQSAAEGPEYGTNESLPSSQQVEAARARVERAAASLAALTADRTSFELDEEVAADVKEAHAALLEAQERSGKLFKAGRGKSGRRALDQAADAERQLLDALGFASYAEFAISASGRIRAGNDGRMQTARVNLMQAQEELADLTARVVGQSPPVSAESTTLARLRTEAAELLGFDPGPDVGQALRSPPPDRVPEFRQLATALEAVGVSAGGLNLDMAAWCDLTRHWLDGPIGDTRSGGTVGRRRGVPVPRGRQRDLDRSHQRATERARRLRELRSEIATSQMRAVVHGDAVGRVADLELAIASNRAHERDAAEAARVLEVEHTQREDELVAVRVAAEAALVKGRSRLEEAAATRISLGEPSTPESIGAELIETQRQLMTAAADVARLAARLAPLLTDLEEMDRQIAANPVPETTEFDRRRQAKSDQASQIEEIEWYLLARLAGQRSESIAGSLPLLLDDPFSDIPQGMVRQLLDWLERMAAAVQLVILTDDAEAAAWVSGLSPERGVLIHAPAAET